ncbi:MAG: hypothetical protein LUE99_15290 [Bacteroides sp.]|nr:hypothetical protein [Bacteroides sp.]
MKISSLLFILYLFCFNPPVAAQQADARDILDRTADAFRQAGGVKIAFTVRVPEGSSKGIIYLKGDKFRLDLEGVTTWFDGKSQWSYLSSSDEVNVSEPTPEELQSLNPYAWLSLYNQGYSLKLDKAGNASDDTAYKIVMTATKRTQDMLCIILYVDKKTLRPLKISMVQRGSKDAVVVAINSYQPGQNYPDAFFVFDKKDYPTAEVVDLR